MWRLEVSGLGNLFGLEATLLAIVRRDCLYSARVDRNVMDQSTHTEGGPTTVTQVLASLFAVNTRYLRTDVTATDIKESANINVSVYPI